jgi:hypothetical protein
MGLVLNLQEQTKDQGVGGQPRTPRLPQMQGHGATTSVRPQVDLRGAEQALKPPLLPQECFPQAPARDHGGSRFEGPAVSALRPDIALPPDYQEGDQGEDQHPDRHQDDQDRVAHPAYCFVRSRRLSGCSTRYIADTMARPPMTIRTVTLSPPKATAKAAAQTGSIAMITAARGGSICA